MKKTFGSRIEAGVQSIAAQPAAIIAAITILKAIGQQKIDDFITRRAITKRQRLPGVGQRTARQQCQHAGRQPGESIASNLPHARSPFQPLTTQVISSA